MVEDRRSFWRQRGVIPRWQQFAAYILIVAAGIVGFISIGNASDKATKASKASAALAISAKRQAEQTADLISEIQQQRANLCNDQNERHDNTIKTLNTVLRNYVKKHPDQAQQVKDSAQSNVLLINALAPKRDCSAIKP